jgi:hypothetical protein
MSYPQTDTPQALAGSHAGDVYSVAKEHVRRAAAEISAVLSAFEHDSPAKAFERLGEARATFEFLAVSAHNALLARRGERLQPWRREHMRQVVDNIMLHVYHLRGLLTGAAAAASHGLDVLPASDCCGSQLTLDFVLDALHRTGLHLQNIMERTPPAGAPSRQQASPPAEAGTQVECDVSAALWRQRRGEA